MLKQAELFYIVHHYGIENQLKKLSEEVYELQEAILKKQDLDKITEEFADVQVLLDQIRLYFDLNEAHIIHAKEFKIDRQINRIENAKNITP